MVTTVSEDVFDKTDSGETVGRLASTNTVGSMVHCPVLFPSARDFDHPGLKG